MSKVKDLIGYSKAIVFDLDGTIYLGDNVIPGAPELINKCREQGKKIFFLTNNSGKSRNEIANKLKGMKIETKPEEIYTSSYTTAKYCYHKGYTEVFVIGTKKS